MHSIEQDLPIRVAPGRVFAAVSTPAQLDEWWTLTCSGTPTLGSEYQLGFGPAYQWRAQVQVADLDRSFGLTITEADHDWTGTVVGFEFFPTGRETLVSFRHSGWRSSNAHFRTTAHCWAMYLRLLRRWLEHGERVPYAQRLEV